ncbi:MAG: type IV conjugative transfer system coupling protein TraD [Thiobacillaceae bacterium]
MAYPVENLLRTPVEFLPAATSFAAAVALATMPEIFLIPPVVAWVLAGSLGVHAAWRLGQGTLLMRYRRNLHRQADYRLSADEIPTSEHLLFLGQGFQWGQQHSQRLQQARLPENLRFREPGVFYRLARRFELAAERRGHARLSAWLSADSPFNPVRPLPKMGGDPVIHGVEPDEHEVWMDLGERVGHMVVLGTTRVGKTRLAELVITQDIRRGDVVIVFDPKGDADLLRRMYAEASRAGRAGHFYFFHLGWPEISARYNPIGEFSRITEVATRTAGPLPSEGQSATFRQFVWRYVNVIARAKISLGQRPSFESIYQDAVNIDGLCMQYFERWLDRDQPGWKEGFDESELARQDKTIAEQAKKTGRSLKAIAMLAYLREHDLHDGVGDALISIMSNDRTYFEKLVSSLYPLLEKLTTGKMAELISPDYDNAADPRPVIDWMSVINQGGIVYVGLDSLTDFEVAGAVGNAMFADLTSIAGKLYKFGSGYGESAPGPRTQRISIHADEFNELIGDEFIPLLNKAGGAGYQVSVYTQTWSDVEARIGSRAKAQQIAGNLNTLIMLRVKNTDTAKILTDQLPEIDIITTTAASQASDSNNIMEFSDFTSRNDDRVSTHQAPMIAPSDLVQLPKGQAFALIEGGRLYKLRIPLPDASDDPHMPDSLEHIADAMKRMYQQHEGSWATGTKGADHADWLSQVTTEGTGSGHP